MERLLKKLGLLETLDLELKINEDQISDSLKKINDSEPITIFNLSPLSVVDYKGTYGTTNDRDKLPIHFDIYPRHYIIFILGLFNITLILSFIGLGITVLALSDNEYATAGGAIAFYLLFLFLFPIRLLKRMQWRVWDLRVDIERELKKREKQLMNTDN